MVSTNISEYKICIHTYLTRCKTNPQPPGFADFLRGTIALFIFSQKYGYNFFINSDHPLFMYLAPNKHLISNIDNDKTIELLPPFSYDAIYRTLDSLFSSSKSFCVMTNSFYNKQHDGLRNFGPIPEACKFFLKEILTPSNILNERISYVFNSVYNINLKKEFKVIHLRCGDKSLHKNTYDNGLYISLLDKIDNLIKNSSVKYVLISDSSAIANKIKYNRPEIQYWDNKKVHLGDLINKTDESIIDTLVDFFIMSKSREIVSNGSGFSIIVSEIYGVPYKRL